MDVRYVNPFIASVRNVFKTMLTTEVSVSKPVVKDRHEGFADVSAVIGLSGDATGCVVLSFPMSTAVTAASKFAGTQMTPTHEDFSDALGELANMVAGQAKASLDGLNLNISLPTVIVGREHVVTQSKMAPRLALPCDSALGRFCVEVVMVAGNRNPAVQIPAMATTGA
jgi:chemotaxis protein CheX